MNVGVFLCAMLEAQKSCNWVQRPFTENKNYCALLHVRCEFQEFKLRDKLGSSKISKQIKKYQQIKAYLNSRTDEYKSWHPYTRTKDKQGTHVLNDSIRAVMARAWVRRASRVCLHSVYGEKSVIIKTWHSVCDVKLGPVIHATFSFSLSK